MSKSTQQQANQLLPSRPMQWTGLILTTIVTFAVLIVPIVAAYITHNAFFLAPILGTIPLGFMWNKLFSFLYPKRQEDYHHALAMRRLELQTKALEDKRPTKSGLTHEGLPSDPNEVPE